MDETLAQVAIDLSGRPAFVYKAKYRGGSVGNFPVELIEEFFKAVAANAKMNLHINVPYGGNNHHIAEAIFKATARALRQAVSPDPQPRRSQHQGLAELARWRYSNPSHRSGSCEYASSSASNV